MTFNKTIDPSYEDNGRRKRLTGYIGQITDESGVVLHSYEYSTHSQAETALNAIVYDLLMDYAERGLVDTLPVCAVCGGDCVNDLDFLAIHRVKTDPAYNYCMSCGNDGDCPDCGLTSLRQDCLNVITMALGQTNGAASVVGELRRVKARLEAVAEQDTDTKQNQPTGWCYVCGSAAWAWDASGPLCPSHQAVVEDWASSPV